jgi:hypothetical protein
MRDAEKALNAANAALSRAEQALAQNSDIDQVATLVNAVKDKQIAALDKEGKLLKEQEYFHKISEETEKLQTKRDEDFAEVLRKELEVAEGALGGLRTAKEEAKTEKMNWDAEDQRLRAVK